MNQEIKKIDEEIKNLTEEIRKEKLKPREKIIEKIKGIKRTTGQHPGGLLITPSNVNIEKYTPLNFPANNPNSELTTHFEYKFLSSTFLKIDILGHDEPTILQNLSKLTNEDISNISFRDKKIMEIFEKGDTLGIPEFGTDFVKKNFLHVLKPTKFSHLVQISGFSHGTDVWAKNQYIYYKNKELKLEELIACREDILKFLISWGLEKKKAFIATEYIRKEKWEELSQEIKNEIKKKLEKFGEKGKIYFSILSKIRYIFPKPHAIAYTMTAWKTAFYKSRYPCQFYSVLLTHHANIYDIWLMTLNSEIISFRLESLFNNLDNYKNSEKELLSLIKVLEELEKEKKKIEKLFFDKENILKKIDIKKSLINIKEKIRNSQDKKNLEKIMIKNIRSWEMSMKEKGLLFTLKIMLEMKSKNFEFSLGLDFNKSDSKKFKIENDKIYFPFNSINGIGEKVAEKIINYRENKEKITINWEEELGSILNSNNIKRIKELQKYELIIW